jgi:hypothetical protein
VFLHGCCASAVQEQPMEAQGGQAHAIPADAGEVVALTTSTPLVSRASTVKMSARRAFISITSDQFLRVIHGDSSDGGNPTALPG